MTDKIIYSEDDTFEKLRRLPIADMIDIIISTVTDAANSYNHKNCICLLNKNGWSEDDYENARRQFFNTNT